MTPERQTSEFRAQAQVRLEFIWTIIWDTLVVATAIVARYFILWVINRTTPADTHGWVVRYLEWIGDVGIVAAAAVFAAFDLLKRVVISARAFMTSLKDKG